MIRNGRGLFDPGLQPERTDLAWRRTTLALAVGALVALRLLPSTLGPVALAIGLGGLLSAAALWLLARRRARRVQRALHGGEPLPGGGTLLGLAILTATAAAVGMAYVLVRSNG